GRRQQPAPGPYHPPRRRHPGGPGPRLRPPPPGQRPASLRGDGRNPRRESLLLPRLGLSDRHASPPSAHMWALPTALSVARAVPRDNSSVDRLIAERDSKAVG